MKKILGIFLLILTMVTSAGCSGEQESAKPRKDGCNEDETAEELPGKGLPEDDRILREIIGVIAECKGADGSSIT